MAEVLAPLLLKNGGENKNLCSLNSVIQLLRSIPDFCSRLLNWRGSSPLIDELINIIMEVGNNCGVSALELRRLLARATNTPLNTGAQHDTIELFGYLLEHCPSEMFGFESHYEKKFVINNQGSACPVCKELPSSVSSLDRFLKIS